MKRYTYFLAISILFLINSFSVTLAKVKFVKLSCQCRPFYFWEGKINQSNILHGCYCGKDEEGDNTPAIQVKKGGEFAQQNADGTVTIRPDNKKRKGRRVKLYCRHPTKASSMHVYYYRFEYEGAQKKFDEKRARANQEGIHKMFVKSNKGNMTKIICRMGP